MTASSDDLSARYHLQLASAYVRGIREDAPALPDESLVRWALAEGPRLHRFKRTGEHLPRVRRVLGMLHGLAPAELLDVGSGRGVFLWPLLDSFPWLEVLALDTRLDRVATIQAVHRGGISRLLTAQMDMHLPGLPDEVVDGVTFLEVLEHLRDPARALAQAVRLARRFVIVSVPSREDDNPEHIHLFTPACLGDLFARAGVERVRTEFVRNHLIALALLGTER
jgi:SAM-dependent methyltransferase